MKKSTKGELALKKESVKNVATKKAAAAKELKEPPKKAAAKESAKKAAAAKGSGKIAASKRQAPAPMPGSDDEISPVKISKKTESQTETESEEDRVAGSDTEEEPVFDSIDKSVVDSAGLDSVGQSAQN